MWSQIATILWAQFRTFRNHLPRTTVGGLLGFTLAIIWYGGFATLAVFLAFSLPDAPIKLLHQWFSAGLLAVFLFWQIVPLITLTAGWSLDLKRLQIYPLATDSLLVTDALLRISAGMEMVLVLCGAAVGLAFHPAIPAFAALALLLYIPFNLFVAVAVRDWAVRLFQKSRFREIFTVLVISIGILPQLILRRGWQGHLLPLLRPVTGNPVVPWHSFAALSTFEKPALSLALSLTWLAVTYLVARRQFAASLKEDEVQLATAKAQAAQSRFGVANLLEAPANLFKDPVAALITKEIRTLLRMPRFRVVFALASLFSVVLLGSFALRPGSSGFLGQNMLPLMTVYGLVILGDALMSNLFGFDRWAAQIYFAAPVELSDVFRAKNAVAGIFIIIQTLLVVVLALLFRTPVTGLTVPLAFGCSAVVGLLFISVGNLISVIAPRSMDPKNTMRKQGGGTYQAWMMGSMLSAALLIGFALLAGWAASTQWAAMGVLAVEFAIAVLTYRFSLQSAVQRGSTGREELLQTLSKVGSISS